MVQKYKEKLILDKICSISGYAWLILVINQEEVGARLGLTKAYVKHIPMFKDYLDLQRDNNKKTWIYRHLGDEYGLHPSSVKRVILNLLRVTKV